MFTIAPGSTTYAKGVCTQREEAWEEYLTARRDRQERSETRRLRGSGTVSEGIPFDSVANVDTDAPAGSSASLRRKGGNAGST
jgi:hypothetical protein